MAVAIDDRSGSLIVGGEEQPSCGTGPGCSAYHTKQTNIVVAAVVIVLRQRGAGVLHPFAIAGHPAPQNRAASQEGWW
jgi:hypothetical protein